MRAFVRAVNALSVFFGMIAAALIGAAILIVCHMVFVRYVLNGSTAWQTDTVIFMLIAATLLGSAYVLRQGGHVTIDLAWEAAGQATRRFLRVMANIGTFLFATVLAVTGGHYFWQAWEGNWLSETVAEIPLWIPFLSMPVGFGLLALQALAQIIDTPRAVDVHGAAVHAAEELGEEQTAAIKEGH
ncbi:TRAP transporter small permease subunit [Dichotomicrobium thermohalophilum]|uniref:TRAP transporter small permease protein n=1 Tax=Dichotomicrobium thermohalophilum TaxID=933063 RepID=A0A397PGI8_9HYPH|nr:TRAP transporter small permease [Dichotomicrobium thermohalophilum]RIA47593.1 TRAP-type C4-dicarboxylate transport system permease small subunit [Dichotomicrobium thermohalophilum]